MEITTPAPERLPLPSRDLLEMQCKLHAALALRAAAEADEEDDDDPDHDPKVMSAEKQLRVYNWMNDSEILPFSILPLVESH